MVDKSSFGYKLRCLRKFRGYTQAELADMLAISTTTLARYEKNETVPHCDVVIRLVHILSISTDMILFNPNPPRPNLLTGGITIAREEAERCVKNAIDML